ncbi:hypothetical protein CFter6_4370 [Collimonas fungivorans]|uniref:Uncharacterized protein n=1 Tax=Collimonas fungivorans TaxID=158899 RepID=A0A127PGN1_9BURK|nr:hypothetical protein CFter6_4370 [Collimonas fungivorans]
MCLLRHNERWECSQHNHHQFGPCVHGVSFRLSIIIVFF